MKNIFLKKAIAIFPLLLTTGIAVAHTESGSLGKPAKSTDLYQVTCSDDGNGPTAYLVTNVTTLAPTPNRAKVSVRVLKDFIATNTTDVTSGDVKSSVNVRTPAGDGAYYVTVGKTAGGVEAYYSLSLHCMSSTNAHTGTSAEIRQNQ